MQQFSVVIQYPLDLVGIFAFAMSGALLAVRKDFDIFGTVVLAEVVGLGGGLFRDIVLGVTPIAFTDLGYSLAPLGAAAIVFCSLAAQRHKMVCETLDAAALALFSVTGTMAALNHGFGPFPSSALGVATAIGGGTFASVLTREIPPFLRWDQDLYALPAVAGAGGVAILHTLGKLTVSTAVSVATATFVIRLLALHYHWRTPRSFLWRGKRAVRLPSPTALSGLDALPQDPNPEHTLRLRLPDALPPVRRRQHTQPLEPLADATVQLRLPAGGNFVPRPAHVGGAHRVRERSSARSRHNFPS